MEIRLLLSSETVASLAAQVADAVAERLPARTDASPWLTAREAAEHLRWPLGRIYKNVRVMPHYKHQGRLMFRRDELDRWLESHREV